jgi:hypothetical protein
MSRCGERSKPGTIGETRFHPGALAPSSEHTNSAPSNLGDRRLEMEGMEGPCRVDIPLSTAESPMVATRFRDGHITMPTLRLSSWCGAGYAGSLKHAGQRKGHTQNPMGDHRQSFRGGIWMLGPDPATVTTRFRRERVLGWRPARLIKA